MQHRRSLFASVWAYVQLGRELQRSHTLYTLSVLIAAPGSSQCIAMVC